MAVARCQRLILLICAPNLPPGNPREVSQRMVQELAANLQRGEQSILLLNRRGYQTVGMCGTCGHVLKCPNCSGAAGLS